MADLIDSIADLTHLHDQDRLETGLAALLFEQVEAAGLRLWRVTRREGVICLVERICLQRARAGRAGDDIAEKTALPLGEAASDLRRCCEQKTPVRSTDGQGQFRHLFPLTNGRETICLLEILRHSELSFTQENLVGGLLRIYGNHLGVLNYGDHDELTGLWNRRTFDESFKRAISSLDRALPCRIHLAVIDIDFFKRINDTFGHPYGDEVLVLLARLMSQSFRDSDLVFRFGGEEFLVMLPNTSFEEAERALERFRAEVENFNFSQVGRVTVSIGFTALQPNDSGPNAFGRADQALYVAKHGGRNQVQCYELLIASGSLASNAAAEQEIELF